MKEARETCHTSQNTRTFPCAQTNLLDEPARRDAARHRSHILDVARTLFAQHGVDAVSMHQIAQKAQIGQGTLYRHFPQKGALCMNLLNEEIVRFQQDMLSYFEQAGSTVPVLEQLRFFLKQVAIGNERHAALLNATKESICNSDQRFIPFATPYHTWLVQVVEVLLQQAIERKEIAPLDIDFTAHAILVTLSIESYYYLLHKPGFDQQRILAGLDHLLFHSLCPSEES